MTNTSATPTALGQRVTMRSYAYARGTVTSIFDGAYGLQIRVTGDDGRVSIWMPAAEYEVI